MKMSFAANNALLKALALLLLFIIMGTAYAMWSEVLKVNAIVNTGEVDAEIVRAYTPDSVPGILDYNGRPTTWPSPEDFVFNPGYGWVAVIAGDIEYWETDKDVAYADTWLEDSDGDGDTDTVYVKMHNAYPGYMIWLSLEVDNVGTIPIFIDYYIVNGTTLTDEQIERNNLVFLDADGDGNPEVLVQLYNFLGDQIDPGDGLESSWRILVLQPVGETQEYVITIQLIAVQWNESIYYGGG